MQSNVTKAPERAPRYTGLVLCRHTVAHYTVFLYQPRQNVQPRQQRIITLAERCISAQSRCTGDHSAREANKLHVSAEEQSSIHWQGAFLACSPFRCVQVHRRCLKPTNLCRAQRKRQDSQLGRPCHPGMASPSAPQRPAPKRKARPPSAGPAKRPRNAAGAGGGALGLLLQATELEPSPPGHAQVQAEAGTGTAGASAAAGDAVALQSSGLTESLGAWRLRAPRRSTGCAAGHAAAGAAGCDDRR